MFLFCVSGIISVLTPFTDSVSLTKQRGLKPFCFKSLPQCFHPGTYNYSNFPGRGNKGKVTKKRTFYIMGDISSGLSASVRHSSMETMNCSACNKGHCRCFHFLEDPVGISVW